MYIAGVLIASTVMRIWYLDHFFELDLEDVDAVEVLGDLVPQDVEDGFLDEPDQLGALGPDVNAHLSERLEGGVEHHG
jgi:hypothetical protein